MPNNFQNPTLFRRSTFGTPIVLFLMQSLFLLHFLMPEIPYRLCSSHSAASSYITWSSQSVWSAHLGYTSLTLLCNWGMLVWLCWMGESAGNLSGLSLLARYVWSSHASVQLLADSWLLPLSPPACQLALLRLQISGSQKCKSYIQQDLFQSLRLTLFFVNSNISWQLYLGHSVLQLSEGLLVLKYNRI